MMLACNITICLKGYIIVKPSHHSRVPPTQSLVLGPPTAEHIAQTVEQTNLSDNALLTTHHTAKGTLEYQ